MKRILPLLALVIGAVWFFFSREEPRPDYSYDDHYGDEEVSNEPDTGFETGSD